MSNTLERCRSIFFWALQCSFVLVAVCSSLFLKFFPLPCDQYVRSIFFSPVPGHRFYPTAFNDVRLFCQPHKLLLMYSCSRRSTMFHVWAPSCTRRLTLESCWIRHKMSPQDILLAAPSLGVVAPPACLSL